MSAVRLAPVKDVAEAGAPRRPVQRDEGGPGLLAQQAFAVGQHGSLLV